MKVKNLILSLIATLPSRALAVSANSKLARQSEDDIISYETSQKYADWRSSIFADGTNSTSRWEAYHRYLIENDQSDSSATQYQFNLLIDQMIQEGLIIENDDLLVTASTSRF